LGLAIVRFRKAWMTALIVFLAFVILEVGLGDSWLPDGRQYGGPYRPVSGPPGQIHCAGGQLGFGTAARLPGQVARLGRHGHPGPGDEILHQPRLDPGQPVTLAADRPPDADDVDAEPAEKT
jgi:hypothetical protein